MRIPAIVCLVLEAVAAAFLIWAWFRDKRRNEDA